MRELLDLFGCGLHTVGKLWPKDHRAHREQARGDVLGRDDRVRHEVEGLTAPGVAGAAKAGDDLVRNHRDIVAFQDRQDCLEIALRRHNHAARAHHRLREKARDGVGAFLDDGRLQLFREPRGELLFTFAGLAKTPVMRAADMDEAGQRQAEHRVIGLGGHRGRHRRHAVIGVDAGDDLAALRVALGGVHEPQHFDHGVVRLRARVGVKHPATLERRNLNQLLRQHHGLVGHAAKEGVIARKAVILRLGGGDQAGVIEAGNHVPQARVRIEVLPPMRVENIRALAVGQHDRAALVNRGQVGEAIKRIGIGPRFPAIRCVVTHEIFLQVYDGGQAIRARGAKQSGTATPRQSGARRWQFGARRADFPAFCVALGIVWWGACR
ncbi:hypothetical protein GALL_448230 [mine drainage metagenome]|uniref:Uncharacterized protein n=1 Tax=mine drainage metagenome TaxID=410659 RepID=A0A1J5PQW0_9ZZZZ